MQDRKDFYGPIEFLGEWDSKTHKCCRLCKTTSTIGKFSHWSKGLCRSCYRRLSAKHRFYNDSWINKNNSNILKEVHKKEYKNIDPKDIKFDSIDIETLLDRYDYRCAYCRCNLQIYKINAFNFMHIEYILREDPIGYELVPICKSCNCSKKNLITVRELQRWAANKGLIYPFEYIKPKLLVQPK